MTNNPVNETPAEPAIGELTEEQKAAEIAEKAEITAKTHAEMWAHLDGKSPFEWPEDARNLYQNGCTCSLWGRSVVDMSPEQRILFVAYVDTVASDLLSQCKGLAMAMEMHAELAGSDEAGPRGADFDVDKAAVEATDG